MDLSHVSVLFGAVLLSAVIFKYVQKDGISNNVITSLFSIIGFILISSPVWNNISIKANGTEFQLIRETTQQMNDYARILQQYQEVASRDPEWRRSGNHEDFLKLSKALNEQANRIDNAIAKGDLTLALSETESGTKLIHNIANRIER